MDKFNEIPKTTGTDLLEISQIISATSNITPYHKIRVKNCINCGEPLKGRFDKRFCDDYCRTNYNNEKNRERNSITRWINRKLARNRQILEQFRLSGRFTVGFSLLSSKGFDFTRFTGILIASNQPPVFECYSECYIYNPDNSITILLNVS